GFVRDGQTARLTQAGLETLAVIAYRQPVSRGRISAIRGVNVDSVVRTLQTHGLIEESGRDSEAGATLYGTTTYFLERLGLGSLDEVPPLAPSRPEMDALDDLEGQLSCPATGSNPLRAIESAQGLLRTGKADSNNLMPASGCRRFSPGPEWAPAAPARR